MKTISLENYQELSYKVSYQLVNSANYGIPQKRERVLIIGIRSDLKTNWVFPQKTHTEERLNWNKYVTGEYWENHKIKPRDNKLIRNTLLETYGIFEPTEDAWLTVRDALKGVPNPVDKHSILDHVFKDGAKSYEGHTGSDIDLPAKTLKAGGHGVPGGENMIRFEDGSVRYFTTYEAKLIQTFPKDFAVTGAWGEAMRQIGNAVPVKLSELIGKKLHTQLSALENTVL